MRKTLSLLIFMAFLTSASAQTLRSQGKESAELVPEGWTFSDAKGDLNKDGIADLVLVATPNNPEHMMTRDDGYQFNFNQPVLGIYWGTANGAYTLYKQYDKILPHAEDEFLFIDLSHEITDKGVLNISYSTFASAGSWGNELNTYVFRYQNADFFLIGAEYSNMMRNTGAAETVSVNYNTHKKQVVKENVMDKTSKRKEKWSKIAVKPLRRLGSFELSSLEVE